MTQLDYISRSRWTGKLTREALDWYVAHELDRTAVNAVIYFDVDNLRRHNDELGKVVSTLKMRNGLRGTDVIGHCWSGDEYCAITSYYDAPGLVERIREQFAAEGMTITTVWTWLTEEDNFDDMLVDMAAHIDYAKERGGRGTVSRL